MIGMYVGIGVLLFLIVLYVLAVMPAIRKNKTVEKLGITQFAHRGLHDKEKGVPENSMLSFKLAAENGFGMELDVHLTKDNGVVIMHDGTTDRLTGVKGYIPDMTSDELRALHLDGTDETVPFLEDLLKEIDGKVPLLIEIKTDGNNHKELCTECFKILDTYEGDYVIESFDPRVLRWLKKNRPAVGRGQLASREKGSPAIRNFALTHLLFNFLAKPHFIAYNEYWVNKIFEPRLCKSLFGAKLYLWTIREENNLYAHKKKGISSIFECFVPKK